MASLPWSSGSATKADGSVWCTDWDNKVNKDGTTKTTSTVAYGFDKGKCSFQYVAEDNTLGLGFKIASADLLKIYVNWIEFASKSSLGADAILPTTDGTNFWIGAYPDGSNGSINMNPMDTNKA